MHQQTTESQPQRQDWYFTFGSGQEYDGKYVVIAGTYDSARERMFAAFDNRWSHQYASAEKAGVEQFGLELLSESQWPEHGHARGVAGGGPGEGEAECLCGVTYAGFDTYREASDLLDRHIAKATGKPVPEPTGAGTAETPTATGPRAELIAGLRALADYYETHPDMPLPAYPQLLVGSPRGRSETDEEGVERVAAAADILGVEAVIGDGQAHVERQFGGLKVRVYAHTKASMDAYHAMTSYSGSVQPEGGVS